MATISDIAAHVGLSPMTVSRALAGKLKGRRAGVAERVAAIEAAARELGYRPNAAAAATRSGRFHSLGVALGGSERGSGFGWMPHSLLHGISAAAVAAHQTLTVTNLPASQLDREDYVPGVLRTLCCDGLLINYVARIPDAVAAMIRHHRLPCLWLNAALEADCVHPDDVADGEALTRHLLELGHRRVAFLAAHDAEAHDSVDAREQGYRAAMAAAGRSPRIHRYAPCGPEGFFAAAPAWLRALRGASAIVTARASEALALIAAAGARGLAVPRDLSLASFTDDANGIVGGLPLTAVRTAFADLGRAAVEALLAKVEQPDIRLAPVTLPGVLYPGATARRMA